ncbi:MAG TPA: helix-turn-helix domain-containing protein [Egibacteraceae bacterium]|nr:helix-turn-helix domain-containing protein [Egibacteraceae bacterium]
MTAETSDASGWISTAEASRRLGVGLRTLYRMIDGGELPAYKLGRVIRIREQDLEAFVEGCRIEPGALSHLYPPSAGHDEGS